MLNKLTIFTILLFFLMNCGEKPVENKPTENTSQPVENTSQPTNVEEKTAKPAKFNPEGTFSYGMGCTGTTYSEFARILVLKGGKGTITESTPEGDFIENGNYTVKDGIITLETTTKEGDVNTYHLEMINCESEDGLKEGFKNSDDNGDFYVRQ